MKIRIGVGLDAQHASPEAFAEIVDQLGPAGLTKFVISPAGPIAAYDEFLQQFTEKLLPPQN